MLTYKWNGFQYAWVWEPWTYVPVPSTTETVEVPVKKDAWDKLSKKTQQSILKELGLVK